MGKYFVGAYAASPCGNHWDADLETAFFDALAGETFVAGLELQFKGAVHEHDPQWLYRNLRPHWKIVLTTIGGAMQRLADDPAFGLASNDEGGRRRALDYLRSAALAVRLLNENMGHAVVRCVEIHSAPRPCAGIAPSVSALHQSLDELRHWDWGGAALAMEHCDAFVAAHAPAKGFLTLEDEIGAIHQSRGPTPIGICVNWGRSAIEARDPAAPHRHILQARKAGLLTGLIFSGATQGSSEFGDWADLHAPFSRENGADGHLLTSAHAAACLAAAQLGAAGRAGKGDAVAVSPVFLGFKVSIRPTTLTVAERVVELRRNAHVLDEAAMAARNL
jgi:hypothetical protein